MQSERCNSERKKMAQKKRRRKNNVSHSPKRKGGKPKMKEKVYA